jgi:uncharacterized protein (TIGR02145 family)
MAAAVVIGAGCLALCNAQNNAFKTVAINGVTWMAENLNVKTPSSWCCRDSASNCDKYGRLYAWEAAMAACPEGWRLPARSEWENLVAFAGGAETAGKKLKAKSGWDSDKNGTDDFGFSALPGGNTSYGCGNDGSWWTATERGVAAAYYYNMGGYPYWNVSSRDVSRRSGYSVRCVSEGGRPAALVGDWAAPDVNLFLFNDGTGLWGTKGITSWRVEGKRLALSMGTSVENFNYSVSGSRLTLVSVKNNARTEFITMELAGEQPAKAGQPGQYFTDSRDGRKYRFIKIGGKTWMAENMNIKAHHSWCYNNDEAYCNKYGRLYTWEAAMAACPKGWRLPEQDDWHNLILAAGGSDDWEQLFRAEGRLKASVEKLKAKSGWKNNDDGNGGNGTDDYGFSALPGGGRYPAGEFGDAGRNGNWWTGSSYNAFDEWSGLMYFDFDLEYLGGQAHEGYGLSVRCIGN